jgi:hypothetical protein
MANVRIPKQDQVIHGKAREKWVNDAARAIISSTDIAMLWKIVRVGGFLEFDRVARPRFKQMAGFDFSVDEVRTIFLALERHVTEAEKKDHAFSTVSKAARKYEQEEIAEFLDDKIQTESVGTGNRVYGNHGRRIH